MQLHARLISRIASLGLGLVFVALITCTLWATARVSLSDLYSSANRGLDVEASLERRHLNDINSGGWSEELAASVATQESLIAISHAPNADDREVAEQTLKLHSTYLQTLRELYGAIDSGSIDYANTVDHEEVVLLRGHVRRRCR